MIKNQKQLGATKAQIVAFKKALEQPEERPDQVDPILWQARFDDIADQLSQMEAEVREYEALANEQEAVIEINSLADLPAALIKARIAAHLTQKQLGQKIHKAEQQVQRWEAEGYQSASFNNIQLIAEALEIQFAEKPQLTINKKSH
ncbi:MAG: helix-turn-helix domain-containing protein [bacterium]|nr:helix-turn-helix domain-containing protein [bacterium]